MTSRVCVSRLLTDDSVPGFGEFAFDPRSALCTQTRIGGGRRTRSMLSFRTLHPR
jgi:hypothetical protein